MQRAHNYGCQCVVCALQRSAGHKAKGLEFTTSWAFFGHSKTSQEKITQDSLGEIAVTIRAKKPAGGCPLCTGHVGHSLSCRPTRNDFEDIYPKESQNYVWKRHMLPKFNIGRNETLDPLLRRPELQSATILGGWLARIPLLCGFEHHQNPPAEQHDTTIRMGMFGGIVS